VRAKLLGIATLALATSLGLSACSDADAEEGNGALETVAVTRGTLDITAEASGTIEPIRTVEVKSKASGEVLRLHVETGMTVPQGALLAEVDPRDVRNSYAQAEADLAVARERLATARAQKQRTEELRDANVVTAQELETASFEEATARAQLIKGQTNLDLARERLNDVAIRAPSSGTIIAKSVEEGTIIASASQNISGGTTLMLMADLAVMQVRALVDETDIGRVQPGMAASVSVEAYPDRRFRGTVYKIEPQAVVEQNVTMFPVLVRLDNPGGLLKPGMNADIAVEIARRENAITVPNAAIVAMRDAGAAGVVLGLSEEDVTAALRGGRGDSEGAPTASGGDSASARPAATRGSRAGATPAAAAPVPAAPEGTPAGATQRAECEQLFAKVRESGGFQSVGEADRAKLRACREVLGMGGRGGAAAAGNAGRNPDVRPVVVFVMGESGPEPRRIMVGLNDWDNTEVISGLEEGEQVVLISVARLQAQQQEFQDRMRERAGGVVPGASAPRSGPR
jgi:HlyD family secretion protein